MQLAIILVVLAQGGSPTIPAPSKASAQALLTKGTALYETGDVAGALEKFVAAYAVYPSPKLFFNIAQAHRDLGQPLEARDAFNRFIIEARDAPASTVAEARRALKEVESKLGRAQIVCSRRGVEIAIDGLTVGTTPIFTPHWVLPGAHKASAHYPNEPEVTETFSVVAGQVVEVAIEPAPRHRAAPETASSVPNPDDKIAAPETFPLAEVPNAPLSKARPSRMAAVTTSSRQPPLPIWVPWAGAGATVALVVGAVVAGQSANDRYNELKVTCGQTVLGCTGDQMNSVRSRDHLTTTLWVLSGAVAAATGVAVYVDTRESGIAMLWRF